MQTDKTNAAPWCGQPLPDDRDGWYTRAIEPGRYRARFMSRGHRDDGVYEIKTGTQGGRPILVACWLGKWVNVEDMRRLWLGPLPEED